MTRLVDRMGHYVVVAFFTGAVVLILVMSAHTADSTAPAAKRRVLAEGDDLLQRFTTAKQTLIRRLEVDYGKENFHNMFFNATGTSRGRTSYQSPTELSRERMVRRLQIKLLESKQGSSSTRRLKETPKFIWATGGHSAAAGHGNFYDESYTAMMEKAAKPVFEAVGIEFVGRNYAMGGTGSFTEIASCVESVFGTDIDVLSWDHGMIDGHGAEGFTYYCYRAARGPSGPACVANHVSPKYQHLNMLAEMEANGGVGFYMVEADVKEAVMAVPDTFGLSTAQIEAMPYYVKSLRCNSEWTESGDPTCGLEKFNDKACPKRKFRTSWHPGYKMHALNGNTMALFMIDLLEDAINGLATMTESPDTILKELNELQEKDHKQLQEAGPPSIVQKLIPEDATDLDQDVIFKGPNLCHTGRLPAEIRHLGILTETTKTGFTTFEEGITMKEADATPNPSSQMRLVQEGGSRQDCNFTVQMDYKDVFYVHQRDGQQTIKLPNAAEAKAYNIEQRTLKGYVAICLATCSWGKCPKGDIRDPIADNGEIVVNGVKVTGTTEFPGCMFLKHDGGHKFKPKKADGSIEIKARANDEDTYFRFSSIVVW